MESPTLVTSAPARARCTRSTTFGPNLRVTEDVTYTDQTRSVRLRYAIRKHLRGTVSFSAAELADLYTAGSDDGTGVFEPGPPRFVGGRERQRALQPG